jgi:trk system potassium uptake protein TrkH
MLMGMVIFPILRIGGMQLFRTESSERSEKIMPRLSQIAAGIISIYSGAILVCFLLLKMTGMATIDSMCNAISAIATCGFSVHVESIAEINNVYSEVVLILGMVFGGGSLLLYISILNGQLSHFWGDRQVIGYLKILISTAAIVSILRWSNSNHSFLESVREGAFNAVSAVTTTGFFGNDYSSWGSFANVLFPVLGLIGGCTGSTSSGIKVFRLQIVFMCIKAHLQQLRRPHGVFVSTYNGRQVQESVTTSVFVFLALYVVTILFATFILSLYGFSFSTAISLVVDSISNVGGGISNVISVNPLAVGHITPKVIIIACMILGRLELVTLLIVFTPSFWKK